jgi:hypothetical protein
VVALLVRIVVAFSLVAPVATAGTDPVAASPVSAADQTAPGSLGPGPTAAFVEAAHQLFLRRSATSSEIRWWSVSVHRDQRAAVTGALAISDEWAGKRVDDLYLQVFGRRADADGRAHWVDAIAGGLRLEDVAALLYGSDEFWQSVGRMRAAYVDALYLDLLGRAADDSGRAFWIDQLAAGMTRTAVAAEFFASLESRRSRVAGRYHEVLHRDPDPAGLRYWVAQLLVLGDVQLAAQLAASAEFHQLATGVPPPTLQQVAVGPGTAYPLAHSWRPGCPVHHSLLVAVRFPHWTYSGGRTTGVLIVHRDVAGAVSEVVRTMYGTAFPLARARPVDDYGGDDDLSMAADNSSAFNCRTVAGTTTWSQHAYGTAVDLDPVRNPYVRGTTVEPPAGSAWLDRSDVRPGMLVEGSPVVGAFDRLGWGWGGRWQSSKDYQHFSTNGR